ncbi:MAG: GNAT family N-acetyltransferase [Sphingobacteriales bacterium]|nr:GNAT family N-acetyltransferase [Sphingobacteriales bacterium]MBP8192341.1 GNAT family N-acetyltransferase [Chitinophagales bacterium]
MQVDFDKEYILENERVLLRPLQESDVEHLLHFSLNEPELWTYSYQQADGEENLKRYIENALLCRKNKTEYPFIIFDKKTQQYAGSTRFYDIQIPHQSLEIGYTWYGKDFQRSGLNRHCKLLLLSFAFETLGAERVALRADNNNKRSIAAMKAIGCIEEGVLRSHLLLPNGRRRDSIILSILKDEWFNTVKEELKKKIY